MTMLMGQPIETWLHVVENKLVDPGASMIPDEKTLLLLLHEAMLLLKKQARYKESLETMRDTWFPHLRGGESCYNLDYIRSVLRGP